MLGAPWLDEPVFGDTFEEAYWEAMRRRSNLVA